MLRRGHWLAKATAALAVCAGGVGASAPQPQSAVGWTADPEDQFLLDVNIRQLRLGDGVRAYNTPEGTCVVLGDFLAALDVPMKIDVGARQASGWAFTENNRITLDYSAMTASYGKASETIARGTIRETPEGWCVQTDALARWFGIGVKPVTSGAVLMLSSEAKLPVELAAERAKRVARLQPAKFDLSALPQVRLPYRMWRAPALDFVVSAGLTYRANDGVRVDRQTSVYAAGEIAHLSYDAQLSTNQKGLPSNVRLRAYRSDPEAGLLGPLKATHFGFGDVEGFDSRLSGSAVSGRGAVVTNRPVAARAAFDRTRFEGDLPSGWEAEIYRNGELLGFAKTSASQRYVFEDVQLLYGVNQIRIVLYGPQGQMREREESIDVGQDNVPAGKTWYWAGFNQPDRDIFAVKRPTERNEQPKAQATVSVEHGIDSRLSVGVIARAMLVDDQRLTFVEGAVRRSIGPAMVELAAARESTGGIAARAQMLGKFGPVHVSAEGIIASDFHLRESRAQSVREGRMALDVPIKLGRRIIPAHAEAHYVDRKDGTHELEAAARLAANINRFNLAADLRYRRRYMSSGPAPPPELNLGLIGTGHVGDVRLRAGTTVDIAPKARFGAAELSAYWSASEKTDWEGSLAYEAAGHRGRARLTHVRRLESMAVALTGEAATDGSVAFGVNLSFSLDPRRGLEFSRKPLAQAGSMRARVYRDLNDNGLHDAAEPFEPGALVTTGTVLAEHPTDARGQVMIGGLTTYTPVAVGLDTTSLADPSLMPRKALQVIIPRPGVPAEVEIGLVGGGDIEGALLKSGGLGFEGVDLELVDASGKVVATARSDFDGFFLFQRVAYGAYSLRVAQSSADAGKIQAELGVRVTVSAERSVVRLGSIHAVPAPQIASAGEGAHSP
jgi:hypothetical protein